jgi:hypothetical protein
MVHLTIIAAIAEIFLGSVVVIDNYFIFEGLLDDGFNVLV